MQHLVVISVLMLTSVTGKSASEQTKAVKDSTKMPIRESTTWLIVAIKKIYVFIILCLLHLKRYAPFATSAMQVTLQLEKQSAVLKRKAHSPWIQAFRIFFCYNNLNH